MTQTAPSDPALLNLPLLFDGAAMRELIARHATDGERARIVACRPRYVRYKPRTSCLVGYEIDVQSGDRVATHDVHVRAFADDRGRQRMGRRKLARLLARVEETSDALPIARVAFLPEVNGMFSVFPVDYELPPLAEIAGTSSAQALLRAMLGQRDLRLIREPDLVRYKPGRKALFRYATEAGVIYGKVHADGRAESLREATATLIAAGLRTPEVLGVDSKLGFIAHAEAPGAQLASLRNDPRYADLLAALAEPLALLHRTPVEGLPVHDLRNEADRLRETGRLLGVILPDQAARLQWIVRVLGDRLARIDDELATSHGDFYDDQAIVDGGRIALIDLDEIRLAHPMLDIGNMLAHLRTGTWRGSVPSGAREAFIDGMRAHRTMSDHDLATFEAIGILKLAPGPFRRLEPDWPATIDGMLGLIEDVIRLPVTPGPEPGNKLGEVITDDKLPELPALQDPARVQDALRAATGTPALELTGIHIQRHKPGRRAIVRYDVAGEEPIWGKIFASRRGPRVYEITRLICGARAFGPDVSLPDPIAFVPELRLLLQRSVPGESIDDRLRAGDEALAVKIADAIHTLHASGLDLGREHGLDKELSPLGPRTEELGTLFPALRDEAVAMHARILGRAGSIQHWRSLPVHRDFYDAQVLADGDRLSVLDLDDAAMSEPAVDIANFAAHLDLLALQHPPRRAEIGRVRDRFLASARALDPELGDDLLAFLTASTMLRLAGIHAPRADGERIAAGLLAGVRAALCGQGARLTP